VHLSPIAEVCGDRLDEVRGYVAAGRYPPPLAGDLVPPDYLRLLDDAGGIEALRAHIEGRYVIAADTHGAVAGPDELDDAWAAFLAGDWLRELVEGTPENVIRVDRLIAAVGRLLDEPAPGDWRWCNRLQARADHLSVLARPGSPAHAFAFAALSELGPGSRTAPEVGE
jgi:hypothetical protein